MMSTFEEKQAVERELSHGGEWLGEARKWMQSNVRFGDSLGWSSNEVVHIPFCKLQELAQVAAVAAVAADRAKRTTNNIAGKA